MSIYTQGDSLQGLSLVINEKNTLKKTGDVKLPDWEFAEVDGQPTNVLKDPKISIELFDLSPSHIAHIKDGKSILIKGSVRQGLKDVPFKVSVAFRLTKMGTAIKVGDAVKRSFEGIVYLYEETFDEKQTIRYNEEAIELEFDGSGKNELEDQKKNLIG